MPPLNIAIPPRSCTSKCLCPNVRLDASRTDANASGKILSRVSPSAILFLKSLLFSFNSSGDCFSNSVSSALIRSTRGFQDLSSFSSGEPKILFKNAIMYLFYYIFQQNKNAPVWRRFYLKKLRSLLSGFSLLGSLLFCCLLCFFLLCHFNYCYVCRKNF